MTATYRVDGMSCQGCANAVSRAIETRFPGVRALVDLAAGTVSVQGQAGSEDIRIAVEEAGYDFRGEA